MKKIATLMICFLLPVLLVKAEIKNDWPGRIGPWKCKKLIRCYGDFISGYADNYIVFLKMEVNWFWDDGKVKSRKELLEKPDLEDMFYQKYTVGTLKSSLAPHFDPGRIRNETFLKKYMGATPKVFRKT